MVKKETFGVGNAEFDHIGIVVKSIHDSKMHGEEEIYYDPIQKVSVSFIELNGLGVELIEPENEKSPVHGNLLKKQALAHICFKVADLELAVAEGRKNGFHAITKPVPAIAFGDRKIVWLFNHEIGLIELVEK